MLKRIAGCSVLILVLGGLCFFIWRGGPEPAQSLRKPNGNVVSLIGVTCGTNHSMMWGRPYQRFLYKILPTRWKSKSGIRVDTMTTFDKYNPVFWFREIPPPSKDNEGGLPADNGAYLHLSGFDEYGCELVPGGSSANATFGGIDGNFTRYQLTPYDPHGEIIGAYVYETEAKTNRLGTFMIPGATNTALPAWTAPSNAVVKDGDMSFQLTSFVTGLRSQPFAYYTNMTNGVLFTHAAFLITTNGQTTRDWDPGQMKIVDANGKKISSRANSHGFKGSNVFLNFEAVLNPSNGPFKIRAQFDRYDNGWHHRFAEFEATPVELNKTSFSKN